MNVHFERYHVDELETLKCNDATVKRFFKFKE